LGLPVTPKKAYGRAIQGFASLRYFAYVEKIHEFSLHRLAQLLRRSLTIPKPKKHLPQAHFVPQKQMPKNIDATQKTLLWAELLAEMQERFGSVPDLQTLLFLIGIQELGQLRTSYTKEEKQDLMHIAVCHLLQQEGYFTYIGRDDDGWPHYQPTAKMPENMRGILQQNELLQTLVLRYFGKI